MIFLITLLIFFTFFLIISLILNLCLKEKMKIIYRINKIKGNIDHDKDDNEEEESFGDRIIKPIIEKLSEMISKITPNTMKKKIEEKLNAAGRPYNLSINQWFIIKVIFNFVIPAIIIIYAILNKMIFSKIALLIGIIIIIMYILPDLMLKQYTKNRQKEIIKALPDILDLLTVSVEAGLSFDGALHRLTEKMSGVLVNEFSRTLNEMRMGKSRKEALRHMSIRCATVDLTTLISSLIQADELGVGISSVLRIQSIQMRKKRKQRAQEKAMKAPIKMLFPLVLFIFPTIFAVLLGPAIIRIIDAFK